MTDKPIHVRRQGVTVPEVSDLLGLTPRVLHHAIQRGKIPVLGVGQQRLISAAWVREQLEKIRADAEAFAALDQLQNRPPPHLGRPRKATPAADSVAV